MPKRFVIPVEFSKTKDDEQRLYDKLKTYSNPQSIIKDILKGTLPVSILEEGFDANNK